MKFGLLERILAGAVAVAVPDFSYADALKFPLVSTADKGTTLDKTRSDKIRKLAEYALTVNKKQGITSHILRFFSEENDLFYGVKQQELWVDIEFEGTKYTISVTNYDEGRNKNARDDIGIIVVPNKKGDSAFGDMGLDGNCDYAWALRKKGQRNQRYQVQVRGRDDKAEAQRLFDQAVDTLLRFYSSI